MIHILLLILKIIGMVLLIILGLLLAAVLLVLFVPVRYRADASYDGKPDGEASLTWLLHLVRLKISFHGHADACGWILWFKLFDIRLWPEKAEETEMMPDVVIPDEKVPKESSDSPEPENVTSSAEPESLPEPVKPLPEESLPEPSMQDRSDDQEEDLTVHATEISVQEEREAESVPYDPQTKKTSETKKDTGTVNTASVYQKKIEAWLRKKMAGIRNWMCSFASRIKKLPGKLKNLVLNIKEKRVSIKKSWDRFSLFLHDERNQNAFRLLKKHAKKLVRYVLPQKLSGRIHFGFDDPYETGQVLASVSPFYGFYAKTLTLEPDFTGTAFDGELHFRGRIAVWYPLWTAARLFLNKDFRRLLRFFRKREAKAKDN